MLLLLFFYACFRSLYFFMIFTNLYSASDVFSFCLISIFGFQGTTHRSNELKIKPACIFIFICICIACLHAVSKSQICECGVLATLLGLSGLEPPTSRLSGVRSNRLSYKPRLLSKCADIWGYARGACTPEHKSLWMHMRRSRGMTNRRFGIPALTNCKCWRSRLLLVLS